MALFPQRALQARQAAGERMTRRAQAIELLEGALSLVKDAETGQRGCLITGAETYLEPYTTAIASLPGAFDTLRNELRDDPGQVERLQAIQAATADKLQELDEALTLHEEGLLSRALIYATDVNPRAQAAEAGVYDADRIPGFTANHQRAGGRSSLSDYYTAGYGRAVFDRQLRQHIAFADHSLATDSVFAEVQFVSCRNVLIYFDRVLQDRAVGLFKDSLCRKGFLGIGAKESIRFSAHADAFDEIVRVDRIFQRSDQHDR